MTGSDVLLSLGLGSMASLVASVVFLGAMKRIRPKLIISTEIARTPRDSGGNSFRIKVVNMSKRAAVDFQALAYLDHPRKVPEGQVRVLKPLRLHSTPGSVLPGKRKGDTEARHARRIRFHDDLDTLWANDQENSLIVRIYARDGTSGYVSEYEVIFPLRRHIKDGSFVYGDSLEIVPL
ncbi:hypothetical protein V5H98_15920 [Georgenia sp. M64]|uniref:hypothetical protein n=1 Tax=Georgenia sp. M64 TaxID=3120520 RepID=UPI0030DECBD0